MREIKGGSLYVTAPDEMPIVAKAMDFVMGAHAADMVDERGLRRWRPLWEEGRSVRAKV